MHLDAAGDPNLAIALYGDSIFDVVQEGASDLEKAWIPLAKNWQRVLRRSQQTGIFGMGPPIADGQWLIYVMFQPAREWPSGLTPSQSKALLCLRSFAGYSPLRDSSESTIPASDAVTLKGLQRFVQLGEKQILFPMYAVFNKIQKERGTQIAALCPSLYSEACTQEEGENMFAGDLKRGVTVGTLEVSQGTYRVLPHFFAWVATPG